VTLPEPVRMAAPPASLRAAISELGRGSASAAESFEAVIGVETAEAWRAVALLGRGLSQQLAGLPAQAAASVSAALAIWADADPGACAIGLAALGRAVGESLDAELGAAFLTAAQRLSRGQPAPVVDSVVLEAGAAAAERGEARLAVACWEEAQASPDPAVRAAAAANLGRLAAARGQAEPALELFEQALELPAGGHREVVADGLVCLAVQAAAEERWDDASERLRAALPLRQAAGDARGTAEVLHDLGVAEWRRGRLPIATRCLEDCQRGAEEIGAAALRGAALQALARISLQGAQLVLAFAYAGEAGRVAADPEGREAAGELLREVGDAARGRGAGVLSAEAFRAAAALLSPASAAPPA
jgi:tetratricopeptide (TPR) repeat protein